MNKTMYILIALLTLPAFTYSMDFTTLKPYIKEFQKAKTAARKAQKAIVEYNTQHPEKHITHDPDFHITRTKPGQILFDARLKALERVGETKKALKAAKKS